MLKNVNFYKKNTISNTKIPFYDRIGNSIQTSSSFNKFENNKTKNGVIEVNNSGTCETIACYRPSNSKIFLSLKSGTIVFFNVCNFCKEIFDKELDNEENEK